MPAWSILGVVNRYGLIIRAGDYESRTSDLGQAASAVKRDRLPLTAVLGCHDAGEPVGTFLTDLRQTL